MNPNSKNGNQLIYNKRNQIPNKETNEIVMYNLKSHLKYESIKKNSGLGKFDVLLVQNFIVTTSLYCKTDVLISKTLFL